MPNDSSFWPHASTTPWEGPTQACGKLCRLQGGIAIPHARAHALDDDSAVSMKRLRQNKQRRRYRLQAGRPDTTTIIDRYAQTQYQDARDHLLCPVNRTWAAKRAALPGAIVSVKCFPKGTKNPKNIPPIVPYENCSPFWDIF